MTLGWTEERAEMAKQLWADGKSASAIAAALGGGVSRNAVIGKLHRLSGDYRDGRKVRVPGAAPKTKRTNPKNNNPTGFSGKTRAKAKPKPPQPFKPAVVEEIIKPISLKVSLLALNDTMCKWPEGDPGTEGFHFCGHRNWNNLPYCEYHSRIAYQPVDAREARRTAA